MKNFSVLGNILPDYPLPDENLTACVQCRNQGNRPQYATKGASVISSAIFPVHVAVQRLRSIFNDKITIITKVTIQNTKLDIADGGVGGTVIKKRTDGSSN